jgi:two-component system response regulator YesN
VNLLIVDDEYYSVDGILQKISAANLGFDAVYCAYSSAQAQELYRAHQIDVMITDIEMPKGNGLELVAWVRGNYPKVLCIFLTSFAKFDYASTAVKLQGFDYLLKPVEEAQLIKSVQKAMERARQIQLEQEQKTQARYWHSARIQLAEQFFTDLACGIIPSQSNLIVSELNQRNLSPDFAEGSFYPILLRCHTLDGEDAWNRNLYEFALKNILSEILFAGGAAPVIPRIADSCYMIMMPAGMDRDTLTAACRSALYACVSSLPGCFIFFIYTSCKAEALHETVRLLMAYARDQINTNSRVEDMLSQRCEKGSVPPVPAESWTALLLAHKTDALFKEAGAYLTAVQLSPCADRHDLIRFYHDFLQIMYSVMDKNGASAHQLFDNRLPEIPLENACDSVQHIRAWVEQVLANFKACMVMVNQSSTAVNEVCQYIRDHLADDLNRDRLAAAVFLSPDYLSHVFREKTGDSLTNYITEQRIKRAKELLLTSNHNIRDIALMSGFANISYFAKQFKRLAGKTPQAYRRAP